MSVRKEFGLVKRIVASGAGLIVLGRIGTIEGADTVSYDPETLTLTLGANTAGVAAPGIQSPNGDVYSAPGGIAMMTGGSVTLNHFSTGADGVYTGSSATVLAQQKCKYSFTESPKSIVVVETSGSVRLKFFGYLLHPRQATIQASDASIVVVSSDGYGEDDFAPTLTSLLLVASGSAVIENDGDYEVETLIAVASNKAAVLGFSVLADLTATANDDSTINLKIKRDARVTKAASPAADITLETCRDLYE